MEAKALNNNNTNQQDASTTYAILWVMLHLMGTYKTDEAAVLYQSNVRMMHHFDKNYQY
jgi:hypothetical protein